MRFCSTIWIGCVLAGAVLGAERHSPAQRITSVVRTDPRSGKLVRSVIVTPKTAVDKPVADNAAPAAIDAAVERVAAQESLPAELLHSVIKVESNYDPFAVSPKGAQGLMQLIPDTARRFGVENAFNPVENLRGGARYLRYLLDLYSGDYALALAAYNAGEGAVSRYGGPPPYAETRNYIVSVKKELERQRKARPAPAPPAPAPRDPAAPREIEQIVGTDGSVRYVSR